MRVLPSLDERDITHLILNQRERKELRKALKGAKGISAELRKLLK